MCCGCSLLRGEPHCSLQDVGWYWVWSVVEWAGEGTVFRPLLVPGVHVLHALGPSRLLLAPTGVSYTTPHGWKRAECLVSSQPNALCPCGSPGRLSLHRMCLCIEFSSLFIQVNLMIERTIYLNPVLVSHSSHGEPSSLNL